jgi:methyl-accepting chemotaxis protein
MAAQAAANTQEVQGLMTPPPPAPSRGSARSPASPTRWPASAPSAEATAKVVKTDRRDRVPDEPAGAQRGRRGGARRRRGPRLRGRGRGGARPRAPLGEAAKQTAALIEDSVRSVDEGVTTTREVTDNFGEINGQVVRVATVMREIGAAVDQQAEGVRQVNTGTEQINQVTQQNAANAEESAATAEELTGQAAALSAMMGRFTLQGGRTPAGAAPAGPRGGRARRPPAVERPPPGPAAAPRTRHGLAHPAARRMAPAAAPAPDAARLIPFDDDADDVLGSF